MLFTKLNKKKKLVFSNIYHRSIYRMNLSDTMPVILLCSQLPIFTKKNNVN